MEGQGESFLPSIAVFKILEDFWYAYLGDTHLVLTLHEI